MEEEWAKIEIDNPWLFPLSLIGDRLDSKKLNTYNARKDREQAEHDE